MKRFLALLFCLSVAGFGCACGSDPAGSDSGSVTLSASPASLEFFADSDVLPLEVSSSARKWMIAAADAWCQTDVSSGSGDRTVQVSVAANASGAPRSTQLTLRAEGAEPVVVSVVQSDMAAEQLAADPEPWDGEKRADITYQILIYAFADSDGDGVGDFRGIVDKLDYLEALGVGALWLSPAHPAASYHGYDVEDYESLDPRFGSEADFKELIDAAHARGIKVYMDYVINHTSKEHPWFLDAVRNPDSPYRSYYVLSDNPRQDIRDGKIPMIATEGAAGYDANQWYATVAGGDATPNVKFTLDWTKKTVTVEQVDAVENSGTPSSGKYLFLGDPGECVEFYDAGDGLYTLSLRFESSWGFLVRTSATAWTAGTKFGAAAGSSTLAWGEPMTLVANTASVDPVDVLMPYMSSVMYHSHFWTSWFADLDYGAVETCADSPAFGAVCNSAAKWIGLGIDGLRLDGAKHVYHNGYSDENPRFWKAFYDAVNAHYRTLHADDIYMVGEMYDSYDRVAPYYSGLPALFEFDYWWRLRDGLNTSTGCYFARDILSYREAYAKVRPDFIEATKLSNHDEDRALSELQGSVAKARLAGAVLLTSCGSPYVYQGEELGFVGTKEGGDEYVRHPMKWGDSHTPEPVDAAKVFAGMKSVADVAAQEADKTSLLQVYRTFGTLRNTYPALASGAMTEHPVYNADNTQYRQIAAWYRTAGDQRMLVLHNFSSASVSLPLTDAVDKAVATLNSVSGSFGDASSVRLGAYSSVVLLLK
ncbi:MAG: alpha-amylase [Alistipes sp.]|nr:alpha-amylase [Alistipes sp.]